MSAISEIVQDHLSFATTRNDPLSQLQQVLVALNHYAGGHFQQTKALCGGISQLSVCRIVKRVKEVICETMGEHIRMPTHEMAAIAGCIYDQFGLPRWALGIDGMHARLEKAPCNISPEAV